MDQQRKLMYDTQILKLLESNSKILSSIVKSPILELKVLPEHLKYTYLGEKEAPPIIISNNLSENEESDLIEILKQYKNVIGWTIADIKGLNPFICMHKIMKEEYLKPSRIAQRRLNTPMMEVVKKEIMKFLEVGIIYSISDNKLVCLVQIVPKKYGVTLVENKEGELVPNRVESGLHVCINYRKLNAIT